MLKTRTKHSCLSKSRASSKLMMSKATVLDMEEEEGVTVKAGYPLLTLTPPQFLH